MAKVSVVIPNFNGKKYLEGALKSLTDQSFTDFETILVDNGSDDGSIAYVKSAFPQVRVIALPENTGFSKAVNQGIQASDAPYVLLLNNDTEAAPGLVGELLSAIRRHPKAFACQAKMIRMQDKSTLDGAGDLYGASGWAFARGKGKSIERYNKEDQVFSCCAGAALYRKELLFKIGLFDEEHFAYLEDTDIGYRARLYGYENWYVPTAVVFHLGSGTSGSRYNQFKVRYSSRNNIFMLRKNMPLWQRVLNLPLLAAGFGIKYLYFARKGFGREYAAGIKNGMELSTEGKKVRLSGRQTLRYAGIQLELWKNLFRMFW